MDYGKPSIYRRQFGDALSTGDDMAFCLRGTLRTSSQGFFNGFGGYADIGMRHVAQERTRTELLSLIDVLASLSKGELEELAAAQVFT